MKTFSWLIEEDSFSFTFFCIAIFIIFLIIRNIFFDDEYNIQHVVFACPIDDSVKCYELVADYVPAYCDEGYCDPPYYTKIYFPSGGYKSFEYCENVKKDEMICYSEDTKSEGWTINFKEKLK